MHTAVLILIVLLVAVATFVIGRMGLRRGRAEDAPQTAPAEPAQIPAASAFVPPDSDATWIDADASKVRAALKAKRD